MTAPQDKHITIISMVDDGIVLEDTNTKQVVKVYVEENKIKCSVENNIEYIQYALIHPEFTFY